MPILSPTPPIQASIRRLLLRRLGAVALAVSAIVAGIILFNERNRVGEAVADRAMLGVARFNARLAPLLDAPGPLDAGAVQRELDGFVTVNLRQRMGHFVLARVRDLEGNEVARFSDTAHPHMEAVESLPHPARDGTMTKDPAPAGGQRYRLARIDGQPHVLVSLPLVRSDGTTAAHIEGTFAVSEAAVADVWWRTLRAVLLAVGIVLLATGMSYPVIRSLLGRVTRLTGKLLDANLETLQVLGSAIAKRDHDTDAHNYRVTVYSVRLAEASGLNGPVVRGLIKGAFLHDVGKIGIRDHILLKPGKLDEAEFEIMKTHVDHGVEIASRSGWLDDASSVVGNHHEKFGGNGYPHGLVGEAIPMTARIFAIADVFDALTSKRPYKEPFSFEETMEMLQEGRGSHFDPDLLDTFNIIARPLYDEFSGKDDELPRKTMQAIVDHYFKQDLAALI